MGGPVRLHVDYHQLVIAPFGEDVLFDPGWDPSEMVHVAHNGGGFLILTGIAGGGIEMKVTKESRRRATPPNGPPDQLARSI